MSEPLLCKSCGTVTWKSVKMEQQWKYITVTWWVCWYHRYQVSYHYAMMKSNSWSNVSFSVLDAKPMQCKVWVNKLMFHLWKKNYDTILHHTPLWLPSYLYMAMTQHYRAKCRKHFLQEQWYTTLFWHLEDKSTTRNALYRMSPFHTRKYQQQGWNIIIISYQ